MISFGPYDSATEATELARASTTQFGPNEYQNQTGYFEWLYEANPAARGPQDCLVARQDGAIVGCIHRMLLPLAGEPNGDRLAVLHNHFVSDSVRAGPGVLLLRRAVKDVAAGFAPGVQAPLDEIYRRLGFQEVPGSWLMRPLARTAAAVQIAASRWRSGAPLRIELDRLRYRHPGWVIDADPDEAAIDTLCSSMLETVSRRGPRHVAWSPALVRWRYFHPRGPRHLWITSPDGAEWAVISLGRRRGLTVARLLEIAPRAQAAFAKKVMAIARTAGASLALCFATDPAVVGLLKNIGWRVRQNGTFSFQTAERPLALGPGASDVGLEAFRTVIA